MDAVLSALDYVVIVAMLLISCGIGVFFAVKAGPKQTSNDYFLGSQDVPVIAVVLSISATILSAVTFIGTPAEVYLYGPTYGLTALSRIHVPIITSIFFVPVYYRLKVVTIYQYIGMRFNDTVRYAVIFIRITSGFLFMGVMMYAPALALSLATGLSLQFSILSVGLICTFYTSIGGIKAVIWTDVFQACAMLIGAVVMIVAGTVKIGGPAEGWSRAVEGGRGELVDYRADLTVRFTIWSGAIGASFIWLSNGVARQEMVQRYNACRTEREARMAAWLGLIGTAVIELLAVAVGMTIFAYYYTCDPLKSGRIGRPDQIVPFFIMDIFSSYPGIPGLLIGCVFCAALSSVSSALNGVVATAGQDVIRKLKPGLSDLKYTSLAKLISFGFGILTIALAFLATLLSGGILQTIFSIAGITGGPICGVIILGMFLPRANSMGAMSGLIGGVAVGVIQYVGSQVFSSRSPPLPLSISECEMRVNMTQLTSYTSDQYTTSITGITGGFPSTSTLPPTDSESHAFFRISYLYLQALTTISCVLVGIAVSYATSWNDPKVADPKFLTPFIARLYAGSKNNHNSENNEQMYLHKI